MKNGVVLTVLTLTAAVAPAAPSSSHAPARRFLRDTMPSLVSRLPPVGSLLATRQLHLILGLPLRNREALTNLLEQLYDPASPSFRHWLSPGQFAEQFGPTEQDYQKVIHFAEAHGLKVTARHANRALLDVAGPVVNIEKAFAVRLRVYQHPTEKRTFYSPDAEPSVEANVPLLHVSGLDNFIVPHPLGFQFQEQGTAGPSKKGITPYATGSSPGGYFMGNDFRAAFVPGVTNTGAGQYIAIVDVGGPYYLKDVYMYQTNAGLSTNIVVTNILLSGWSGIPTGPTDDDGEEVLDICLAMSMAPGATILNYEGEAHDVFNRIATDNLAKQMTLSYGFGIDASIIQTFQQFAAQGQSFSQASGDGGADFDGGLGLTGNPYATIVGGTSLTTSGAGGAWQSETTWPGSGGGVSGYGIPDWQQGVGTPANQASAAYRNYPDVAMPAVNVFTIYRNGTVIGATGGTSASSPLWAGFMALANEEAAAQGKPPIGFVNPALYRIGLGPITTYTACFHDITTGNTFNSHNPSRFRATPGYDLCTGWGTPTGSNTLNALAGVGTNDFTFSASPTSLDVVRGGVATSIISVTRMNGLGGSVNLSLSGLPEGVSAVFSPAITANTSLLTLAVGGDVAPGFNTLTLSGASGSLTHHLKLNLAVALPIPGAVQVELSSRYNRAGIYTDGRTFSGGFDGVGYAYSANLLGPSPSWNGARFELGPANAQDVIVSAGQTIMLPPGRFTSLLLLAAAVNGNQANQKFTVKYTDNSMATFTQGVSDWFTPQDYPGESRVVATGYRNTAAGGRDRRTFNVYAYSFTLDQTRTVGSLTLPSNGSVLVLALTLADAPGSAPLATYFNRAGMYLDGVTFTNPATGGVDGGGAAYSATLLGGSQTWTNTQFNFGPPNVTNVISGAGQTVTLPAGNYSALRLLATGVQGNQPSQPFVVAYADGTSSTFVQNLSDWFTPQNYPGESRAVVTGHRNWSDGTKDSRTFYLYGYSFNLNGAKVVRSVRLPNNANVIVTSVSLIPNWPPVFPDDPFAVPDADAGQAYFGTIAARATDLNGDALSFVKLSGPDWLHVSANGTLSGTPLSADVGTNAFVVRATDPAGSSGSATMTVNVAAAPSIVAAISSQGANLWLTWTGGIAPYRVQMTTNLAAAYWQNVGDALSSNGVSITPSNAATFYRIHGQ